MDLITTSDLKQLAEPGQSGPCISLFCPTHRYGAGVQGDPIRWKNLLIEIGSVLHAASLRGVDTGKLLEPAAALRDDPLAWQYMSDGLAMFLRPDWYRMFRVPAPVPHVGTVGDRFVVGPLLRILTLDGHFLLLALSQQRVRLLEGSLQHVEEIDLAEVPTSLREISRPRERRSAAMAWSAGTSSGGPAVFYGHGAADDHVRTDELRTFLQRVAGGVDEILAEQRLPLVLVGLEEAVSIYRDLSTYPYLAEGEVRKNPDPLSDDELRAAARPVVEQILTARRARDVARYEALQGTGRASNDLAEISDRAAHGRVETLFLAARPWCWERDASGPLAVHLGADHSFARCEELDRATADTLRAQGDVYAVPQAEVPGGGDVAAIFRY